MKKQKFLNNLGFITTFEGNEIELDGGEIPTFNEQDEMLLEGEYDMHFLGKKFKATIKYVDRGEKNEKT